MVGYNFGNIRTNPANAWQGKVTAPGAAFESFDTPENGVRAVAKLLRNYGVSGVDTLEGIVSRYSPPNENRTPQLVQAAAERTGYLPAQRLDLSDPAVLDTVTRAIITQEVGNAGPGGDVVQRGVKAALPSAVPTRNVSMLPTPQPAQENGGMAYGTRRTTAGMTDDEMLELSRNDAMPRPNSGGLLDVDPEKNFYDGLGGLLGNGQTPSQPPGPTITQGQYQLAGASDAISQLAGVHNRKVGIGEMLGALGGGLMRGTVAGQQAGRQQWEDQRKVRADQLAEQEAQSQSALRAAQAQHYGRAQGNDPKVVGKWIYENGQWKAPPGQADAGGPFEGTAETVQMYNQLIMLEQKRANGIPLSPQETYTLDLIKRNLTAPKQTVSATGEVVEQTMPPLPVWGGQAPAPAPPTVPPPTSPPPANAGPTPQPPANAGPTPQPRTVVTPSGATVTQVTPGGIPAGEQTDLRKKIDTLNKLNGSVATLGNNVEKMGMQVGGFGALSATQGAMYEDLQTQLRLANELGVLNGPDERKLLEQISNPTSFMTYVKGLGGPSYFNAQMQVLKDKIAREIGQYEERLGIRKPDAGSGSGGGSGGPTTVLKFDGQGNIIK